jgi:uncharacterized protein (DUF1778 family)
MNMLFMSLGCHLTYTAICRTLTLLEEKTMASLQRHKGSDRDSSKKERLEARITTGQKTLFLRAATLTGRSLTDFVVASAQEKAMSTVREYEAMTLSARDTAAFVSALLNPPAPGERLRKAARRYKQHAAR